MPLDTYNRAIITLLKRSPKQSHLMLVNYDSITRYHRPADLHL